MFGVCRVVDHSLVQQILLKSEEVYLKVGND